MKVNCLIAMIVAENGLAPRPGTVERGGRAVKGAAKGVQDSLKRLFGN